MTEIKVEIENKEGEKLVGIETRPETSLRKYSTVILVHGFGVTKEEYGMFNELAAELAKAGILSYRFDFSGCGESQGDYSDTTLTKLKEDLASILEFVSSQKIVYGTRVGIHAQSFGTSVSVALNPSIKAMILTGAVAHPKEVLIRHHENEYNPKGMSKFVKKNGRIITIKPTFWKDLENYNLLSSVEELKCPVLFINGSKDKTVPLLEAEELYEKVKGIKEKVILLDADHGLLPKREEMYKLSVSWFLKHL